MIPAQTDIVDKCRFNGGTQVACTLVFGDDEIGAAALINSLYAHGFRGRFVIGCHSIDKISLDHREAIGDTIARLKRLGITIELRLLTTRKHYANYKPEFIDDVWGDEDLLFYFDPDVVVDKRWDFFTMWAWEGVAACADICVGITPATHPVRIQWGRILEKGGLNVVRNDGLFYNSGFLGLHRRRRQFLDLWRSAHEWAVESGESWDRLGSSKRENVFGYFDMDALNVAIMAFPGAVCLLGPEAMGFAFGDSIMYHVVGPEKPWRIWFLARLVRGIGPTRRDKKLLYYLLLGPMLPLSHTRASLWKLDRVCAAGIGRYIGSRG